MDDDVGTEGAHGLEHRVPVGHVEPVAIGRHHVVGPPAAVGGQGVHQVPAQLPAGAGHEHPGHGAHAVSSTGARPRSGSHHARFAEYHVTVSASPCSKEIDGSQPSRVRIFEESSR